MLLDLVSSFAVTLCM